MSVLLISKLWFVVLKDAFSLLSCGSSSGRSPPAVFLSSWTRWVFLWGGGGALVADAPSMIKCGETETEMGRRKTPGLPLLLKPSIYNSQSRLKALGVNVIDALSVCWRFRIHFLVFGCNS